MKKRRKPLRAGRLQFERLEGRYALAGNVTVTTSGADLKISGDNLENAVTVSLDLPNGNWVVTGVNDISGVDTTVNGEGFFNVPIPNGGFRNVIIDMKGALDGDLAGADSVTINGVSMTGKLDIKGKNGGVVDVDNINVTKAATIKFGGGNLGSNIDIANLTAGSLAITTGNDNDVVGLTDSDVAGKVTIKTNGGNDQIDIDGDYVPGFNILFDTPTIRGNLDVQTGEGNDAIRLVDNKVNGKTSLKAGKGQNQTIIVQHNVLGIASDFAVSSAVKCNDVFLSTEGTGAALLSDTVTVEDNIMARHLTISTKTYHDVVTLRNTFVGQHCTGNLKISTGDGNDTVTLDGRELPGDTANVTGLGNRVTGTTTIDTGKQNDEVQIGRGDLEGTNHFEGKATVSLGDGVNSLAAIGDLSGIDASTFASTTRFISEFNVSMGKDDDSLLCLGVFVGGNRKLADKGGDNVIASTNSAFLGNLSVTTGAGNDVIGLGTIDLTLVNAAFEAQDFVGGTTTLKTGAGNDLVEVDNVNLVGKVTATLAAGRDQLKLHNGTQINVNTAVASGGSAVEDNRGEVNGADLGAVGAPGFVPGGVDANFEALVDAGINARFNALINEILANV